MFTGIKKSCLNECKSHTEAGNKGGVTHGKRGSDKDEEKIKKKRREGRLVAW